MSRRKPCPNEAEHTPHPTDYMSHAEWAEGMLETHRQITCEGCGRLAIWVPKDDAPSDQGSEPAAPLGENLREENQ